MHKFLQKQIESYYREVKEKTYTQYNEAQMEDVYSDLAAHHKTITREFESREEGYFDVAQLRFCRKVYEADISRKYGVVAPAWNFKHPNTILTQKELASCE